MLGLSLGIWRFGGNAPLTVGGVAAAMDLNFQTGSLLVNGSPVSMESYVACTRAGTANYVDSNGLLVPVPANTLRRGDLGLLSEPAATNVALWCRDLTNAAWVKSNTTAALTQTGIDGTANSASLLTATAGNGTCLQTVTLGSSSRLQSAYVKRITGSGTVNMTTDNGTTWTVVTVTAGWTRVTVPAQTVTNPVSGFRLVTSGDAIAIDFVQNETGVVETSPITTTTAAVTRAADIQQMTSTNFSSWFNAAAGTFVCYCTFKAPAAHGTPQVPFSANDGTNNNRILMFRVNVSGVVGSRLVAGGVATNPADISAITQNVAAKLAIGYAVGAGQGASVINGGALATSSPASAFSSVSALRMGTSVTGEQLLGTITRMAYFNTRLSDANMQAVTT